MDKWLNPETSAESTVPTETAASVDDDDVPFATPAKATVATAPASPTAAKAKGKDSVEQAFDDLFNS